MPVWKYKASSGNQVMTLLALRLKHYAKAPAFLMMSNAVFAGVIKKLDLDFWQESSSGAVRIYRDWDFMGTKTRQKHKTTKGLL